MIELNKIEYDRRQSPSDDVLTIISHGDTPSKDYNVSEKNQIKINKCQTKITSIENRLWVFFRY